jgi:hypothetical protein
MKYVDRREEELRCEIDRGAKLPGTVAEIDVLEKELADALEALKARRAELQRDRKSAGEDT